jgi:lipase chaperone LimK
MDAVNKKRKTNPLIPKLEEAKGWWKKNGLRASLAEREVRYWRRILANTVHAIAEDSEKRERAHLEARSIIYDLEISEERKKTLETFIGWMVADKYDPYAFE